MRAGFFRPLQCFAAAALILSIALCSSSQEELPTDPGEGSCSYSFRIDRQDRELKGLCGPVPLSDFWSSLPDWFRARYFLAPDQVLRAKLRIYSANGSSRALILNGKRYDLIAPDHTIQTGTSIIIE